MKLDEKIKKQIDSYFDNISAKELYSILTLKYNFPVDNIESKESLCDMVVSNQKYDVFKEEFTANMCDATFAYVKYYNAFKEKFTTDICDTTFTRVKYYDTFKEEFTANICDTTFTYIKYCKQEEENVSPQENSDLVCHNNPIPLAA